MPQDTPTETLCYYLNQHNEEYGHLWYAGEDPSKVALKVIRYLEAKLRSVKAIIEAKE